MDEMGKLLRPNFVTEHFTWLGHSTFATTADIYSHLDYSEQIESGQVMNGMYM